MIVHFIATQHSIDINYTYLKKVHDIINQLGHKPSRKWLSKECRFIELINRKDGINWGVFIKKDLEAIGGADLVVAEVTDENIAIGYQIAVAVQQKKPVLMLIAMTYRLSASLATSTLTLINLLLLKGTT